jgi:hypothetical protein
MANILDDNWQSSTSSVHILVRVPLNDFMILIETADQLSLLL